MKNTYLVIGSIAVTMLSFVFIFGLEPVMTFLKHLLALIITVCLYWYLAVQAPGKLFEKLYYEKQYERIVVWIACVSVWIFSYVALGWYFGLIGSIVEGVKVKIFLTLMGPMLSLIVAVIGVLMSTIYFFFGKDRNDNTPQ